MKKLAKLIQKTIKNLFSAYSSNVEVLVDQKTFSLILVEENGDRTTIPISKEATTDYLLLIDFAKRLVDKNPNQSYIIVCEAFARAEFSVSKK